MVYSTKSYALASAILGKAFMGYFEILMTDNVHLVDYHNVSRHDCGGRSWLVSCNQ